MCIAVKEWLGDRVVCFGSVDTHCVALGWHFINGPQRVPLCEAQGAAGTKVAGRGGGSSSGEDSSSELASASHAGSGCAASLEVTEVVVRR